MHFQFLEFQEIVKFLYGLVGSLQGAWVRPGTFDEVKISLWNFSLQKIIIIAIIKSS